jgi:SPP1 family predicted phage head-tail adaptor
MIAIPSGQLNKRVDVLTPSTGQNPATGDPLPPVAYASVWASIKPMSGAELYRAQQFVSEANILVVIRYRAGMHEKMTLQYTGPDGPETLEILAILNEMQANVQLNLLCKRIDD